MYITDNIELHIRVITEISPGDNFYIVKLFPLICPHSEIELDDDYYNLVKPVVNWQMRNEVEGMINLRIQLGFEPRSLNFSQIQTLLPNELLGRDCNRV